MKTVTLATFHSPEQAEPLRRRLEEAHIAAWIHYSGMLKHLWFVRRRRAEFRLDVKAQDFEQSQQLLNTLESKHEKASPLKLIHCPECHSTRVIYPQFTGKFLLPNVVGLLSGLGLVRKAYYCEDCHFTWMPKGERSHKHRAHMAPYYFLEDVSEKKSNLPDEAKPADWQGKGRSPLDD